MLAGHANVTTTQRYMNARANSQAESMRQARQRIESRINQTTTRRWAENAFEAHRLSAICQPSRSWRPTTPETFQIVRENGGEGRNRTVDTTIFSRMLYQLSYLATRGMRVQRR
jgi:hypothetical protein